MVKKYRTEIEGYEIKSMEWNGQFDLYIYKGDKEVYRHPNSIYSLKDASTVVRQYLNLKGKRIKWEEITSFDKV